MNLIVIELLVAVAWSMVFWTSTWKLTLPRREFWIVLGVWAFIGIFWAYQLSEGISVVVRYVSFLLIGAPLLRFGLDVKDKIYDDRRNGVTFFPKTERQDPNPGSGTDLSRNPRMDDQAKE